MSSPPNELPIYEVADQLIEGLQLYGKVVLSAPTGSGKSTQVPQMLLDRGGIAGDIVVLQPRRLAARMLAQRVAAERAVPLGDEVGYQIRFENRIGPKTRIRFVTEAILLRQILQNPELPGVGAIVFDEFHERHLSSDLSLATALQSVQTIRDDLKLVVMSATLDIDRLESFLKPCARVEAGGRLYPVDVRYLGASLGREVAPVWERAARAFRELVRSGSDGDVLIFMPGAFEIRKTIDAIEALSESRAYTVLPLHGELPPDEQDRAVRASDCRKVIVSTNVAETSITIEGVRTVIDGGLARIARFDPNRGLNSILIEPISQASAEQRRGRAGRTGPGQCWRLWSEVEQQARNSHETAEVQRVDLAEAVLMLAVAGYSDLTSFSWYEAPSGKALERALDLLKQINALSKEGEATDTGEMMSRFPLHPRYTRLLLEADRLGVLPDAALIAAISQGRPFYRASRDSGVRREQMRQVEDSADPRSDFFVHLRAFALAKSAGFKRAACEVIGVHAMAARQAAESARQIIQLAESAGLDSRDGALEDAGERLARCLLAAFSDQLCLRNDRGTRRCRMVQQRSGELRRESIVDHALFVSAEIREQELRGEVNVLLGLATAVEIEWLHEFFPDDFSEVQVTRYETSSRRVVSVKERRFRDLILDSNDSPEVDYGEAASLLAAEVLEGRLVLKQWNAAVDHWIHRLNFVARHCPETELTRIDDAARALIVEQICHGACSYKEIKDRPVLASVKEWIRPEEHYYVDTYAPEAIELPRRKRPLRIRYEADGRAVIASKIQDFYDVPGASLRLANGAVAPLVELLAPNGRPAHLTEDLDGFWEGAYRHVRRELAGRYPKHEWR